MSLMMGGLPLSRTSSTQSTTGTTIAVADNQCPDSATGRKQVEIRRRLAEQIRKKELLDGESRIIDEYIETLQFILQGE
jgi:hypothetical protein